MENVGQFLRTHAVTFQPGSHDYDIFARSSFNRYYYALFLEVRSMLRKIDLKMNDPPHAKIPEFLEKSILPMLAALAIKVRKTNEPEAIQICEQAKAAARELAGIMKEANAVRVAADYKPEMLVQPDAKGQFKLHTSTVNDAHHWNAKAKALCRRIERAWLLKNG